MAARKTAVVATDDDDEVEAVITGLELFDDDSFSGLTSYFYREQLESEPEGPQHGYCWKTYGSIDPEVAARELGGGRYRVLVKSGREIVQRHRIKIAGAPRQYRPPAPVTTPTENPPASWAIALDELRTELRALRALPPAPSASDRLGELATMFGMFKSMLPTAQPFNPSDALKPVMESFQQGFDLARKVEGGDGGGPMEIISKIVDGVTTLAQVRAGQMGGARPTVTRSGAAPPAPTPGAPPSSPSGAAVVEDDPYGPLLDLLLRSYQNGRSAEDAADSAEILLTDAEAVAIRGLPDAAVLAYVFSKVQPGDDATRAAVEAYVLAFLARLREEPESETA